MGSISRNIFFIALGVIAEAAIILVLRYSWGWLLEQGTDPFLVSVVVILVSVSSGILFLQISVLRRDVKTLRVDVDILQEDMRIVKEDVVDLRQIFNRFLTIFSSSETVKKDKGLEGSMHAFSLFVGAKSHSPWVINDKGREFLAGSHLEGFVYQKKDEMFALLDKTGFKTEFLLQKECFVILNAMLEKPENKEWVDKAEKYAYEEGDFGIFQYTGVASLLLRDLYFEARGFPPADKSKRPAWEAAQAAQAAVVRDGS